VFFGALFLVGVLQVHYVALIHFRKVLHVVRCLFFCFCALITRVMSGCCGTWCWAQLSVDIISIIPYAMRAVMNKDTRPWLTVLPRTWMSVWLQLIHACCSLVAAELWYRWTGSLLSCDVNYWRDIVLNLSKLSHVTQLSALRSQRGSTVIVLVKVVVDWKLLMLLSESFILIVLSSSDWNLLDLCVVIS